MRGDPASEGQVQRCPAGRGALGHPCSKGCEGGGRWRLPGRAGGKEGRLGSWAARVMLQRLDPAGAEPALGFAPHG